MFMLGTLVETIIFEMFPFARCAALTLLFSAVPTLAQFPAEPAGRKVLESRFGDGVTITYKEVGYHRNMSIPSQVRFL